jgi:hypothetical protein
MLTIADVKREQFLSRLRRYCRKNGLSMTVDVERGKGSHVTVEIVGRMTIVKSGELTPGYVALLLKQLGLPRGAL